jgi:hypothetical protein
MIIVWALKNLILKQGFSPYEFSIFAIEHIVKYSLICIFKEMFILKD